MLVFRCNWGNRFESASTRTEPQTAIGTRSEVHLLDYDYESNRHYRCLRSLREQHVPQGLRQRNPVRDLPVGTRRMRQEQQGERQLWDAELGQEGVGIGPGRGRWLARESHQPEAPTLKHLPME